LPTEPGIEYAAFQAISPSAPNCTRDSCLQRVQLPARTTPPFDVEVAA
jgi:hypothetical protein